MSETSTAGTFGFGEFALKAYFCFLRAVVQLHVPHSSALRDVGAEYSLCLTFQRPVLGLRRGVLDYLHGRDIAVIAPTCLSKNGEKAYGTGCEGCENFP